MRWPQQVNRKEQRQEGKSQTAIQLSSIDFSRASNRFPILLAIYIVKL